MEDHLKPKQDGTATDLTYLLLYHTPIQIQTARAQVEG